MEESNECAKEYNLGSANVGVITTNQALLGSWSYHPYLLFSTLVGVKKTTKNNTKYGGIKVCLFDSLLVVLLVITTTMAANQILTKLNAIKITFLMLISVLIADFAKAQYYTDSLSLIRFHYGSAMRIPYNEVEISLIRFYNHKQYKYKVIVESSPLYDDGRYEYSYVDTSYFISIEEFQSIFKLISDIKPSDIYSTATMTDDGSSCEISFGNFENNISYQISNPGIEIQKRKLDDFIKACQAILQLAKLDPEEILE